jgi:hypothetical protein
VPVDALGQQAAQQQADRRAGRGHEAVDADRLRLLARLGEHRHDHAEDHGGRERAARALDEACADQDALALGQPAQQRGCGEDGEAGQEDAAAAEQVSKAAGQQQQSAEADQVGVHDPGEVRLGEPQIVLDRRQGDVHDRRVEDDHQHAHAEDVEGDPAGAVRGGLACGGWSGTHRFDRSRSSRSG